VRATCLGWVAGLVRVTVIAGGGEDGNDRDEDGELLE
jgi:hypothetical protein